MSDLWKLEVTAKCVPPKYWTAEPSGDASIALGPRHVEVAPARYCIAGVNDDSLLEGLADGRAQFTQYRGHIIELQHHEDGELELLVELLEEPVGPTWIASWTKKEWSEYTKEAPSIAAQIEASSWWDAAINDHRFEARFVESDSAIEGTSEP